MCTHMLNIKFKKTHPQATLPTQAKPSDAGYDLCCVEYVGMNNGGTYVIPTGLVVADVKSVDRYSKHFLHILSRSGLATKGVFVLGGVVDTGYRGEIKVIIHNSSGKFYEFFSGDKIAQLVIQCIMNDDLVSISESEEVTETARGAGGLGSTGS